MLLLLIWWQWCRLCVAGMILSILERFFHMVTCSWCVVHWSPKAKGKGESRRVHIDNKEYNVAAMKVNCVYTWSRVYSFHRFCFKKMIVRNRDKNTQICTLETLNDYTLYQLDAGKCARRYLMCHCLSMCHCLILNFSQPVCTYIGCNNLMMGIEKCWVSRSSINLLMLHLTGWNVYEWQSSNML
jgi:hypothetical protein